MGLVVGGWVGMVVGGQWGQERVGVRRVRMRRMEVSLVESMVLGFERILSVDVL